MSGVEGIGIVDPFADDHFGRGNNDMVQFDVGYDEYDSKPKKNKNNSNSKKTLVEVKHEGFILEKAQPLAGERSSWSRIGQRPLPFDEKMLVDIVKRHRKSKGTTVDEDYKQLSPNQQAVVTRLLEERKRKEKTKNADWILYNVQRIGKRTWRSVDVKQLQVILKRIDKTLPLKNGEYTKNAFKTSQYQDFEIIDLAEPNKDKKKDKKLKKSKSFDDVFGDIDDRNDPLGISGFGPPQRDHGRNNNRGHDPFDIHHHNNNNHQHFDNHMPRQSQQFDHMPRQSGQFDPMQNIPAPPTHGPPGAFPGAQNPFDQLPPQPFAQPFNQQQHHPQSARHSFSNINPFQPDPNIAPMAQFDNLPPVIDDQVWPHPHQHGRDRDRARSLSRERRPSARRPSLGIDTGNMRRLENKIDDLAGQISTIRPIGSESDEYEGESVWSIPSARSFTPPSSPRSYFSDKARGSLERRRSSAGRDPRYHTQARYRSHRYRDVEVEPAYTYRSDRREYSPEVRRNSQRPKLLHAQTYDDYPMGSSAEPRNLPLAPQPPRQQPQRRLTDFEDRDRYENRGYDDRRQSDYRDAQGSRRHGERYDDRRRSSRFEGGRRDSAYDAPRRRSTFVGGGGDYYN